MPHSNVPVGTNNTKLLEPVPLNVPVNEYYNASWLRRVFATCFLGGRSNGTTVSFTKDAPRGLLPATGVTEERFSSSLQGYIRRHIDDHANLQLPQWHGQLIDGTKVMEQVHDSIWHNHSSKADNHKPHPREIFFSAAHAPWSSYAGAEMRAIILRFYQGLQESDRSLWGATKYDLGNEGSLGKIVMRDFSVKITKPGDPERSEYHSPAIIFYPERIVLSWIKNANHYDQKPNPEAHYLPTHVLLCMSALLMRFLEWKGPHRKH